MHTNFSPEQCEKPPLLPEQILLPRSAIAGAVKLKAKTAKPTNENDFFIISPLLIKLKITRLCAWLEFD
ncbi:protein of unknown function [Kingella kingae]|nr:protein of unknown function [Kingella kingae]